MKISLIKNPNFEKPSMNLSNRNKVKILKKKIFGYLSTKFGSAYAQSPRKCSNIEILVKIEGKDAKFFSKIYEGHIRIWFRYKKNSKLSHAWLPLIHARIFCIPGHQFLDQLERTHCKDTAYSLPFCIWTSKEPFLSGLTVLQYCGYSNLHRLSKLIYSTTPILDVFVPR